MEVDLFGNRVVKLRPMNSMQRSVARQVTVTGRDLYTTEPEDIERFIMAIRKDGVEIPSPIWEPAAGMGDISKTLAKYGYDVRSTDICAYSDKEIDIAGVDFLVCADPSAAGVYCKTIFTNPPFNAQEAFLEHALSFGVDVVFFVRMSFLSSIRRYKIYERYNPAYVYVYSRRAHCYKDGDTKKNQGMIDYCVIMWKPPYRNESVLRWIA
jgi:hypothetical protein